MRHPERGEGSSGLGCNGLLRRCAHRNDIAIITLRCLGQY